MPSINHETLEIRKHLTSPGNELKTASTAPDEKLCVRFKFNASSLSKRSSTTNIISYITIKGSIMTIDHD